MVSFDVVSLFTSVRINKALNLVPELVSSNRTLPLHPSLDVSDVKHDLKFCLLYYFS